MACDVLLVAMFSHENYLPWWPPLQVACPPLTGVIYLSSLSKQPISVSCHHPNGGFYLNKEKWPKSQGRHSNTGYCQISAHTHLKWDLWDLPQIFRFGVKFLEILFLWGATSLDSSGPLNDFLNWRKFSWLPHNGLDRVVTHLREAIPKKSHKTADFFRTPLSPPASTDTYGGLFSKSAYRRLAKFGK